jgi:hypothetical protein
MARDTVVVAAPLAMKPERPCGALILTRIVQNRKGEDTNVPVVAIPPITLPGDPPTARGGDAAELEPRREIQSTTKSFSAPIRHRHVPRAQANHPDLLPTPEWRRRDESAAAVSCLRAAVYCEPNDGANAARWGEEWSRHRALAFMWSTPQRSERALHRSWRPGPFAPRDFRGEEDDSDAVTGQTVPPVGVSGGRERADNRARKSA